MTEARVAMLDPDAAQDVAARVGVPDALAGLNVFQVLLRRERLAKGVADLLLSLLFGGDLHPRLRELAIMRIGWVTGSVYEWSQHWQIALDAGVAAADLLGVRQWERHDGFSHLDRAVLAAVDESLGGRRITDDTWAALRGHLDEYAAVELVAAIGAWTMVSTILRSLDVPLEDSMAAWPPDGAHP